MPCDAFGVRGSGRTTRQMQMAPPGSCMIVATDIAYYMALRKRLFGVSAFDGAKRLNIRPRATILNLSHWWDGTSFSLIFPDHYLVEVMSEEERETLREIKLRHERRE